MTYYRFESREPKPVEYRTLADVPNGVRCVVVRATGDNKRQMVRVRDGDVSLTTDSLSFGESPHIFDVIQVLDQIPDPPLPKTLADVEEGRCVKLSYRPHGVLFFRVSADRVFMLCDAGAIIGSGEHINSQIESLTDIYAVRYEVAE